MYKIQTYAFIKKNTILGVPERSISLGVHNFLENRKKTKNNFSIYLIHLISKLESVDF